VAEGEGALTFVMPGLVPGIRVFLSFAAVKAWMAGSSPAMTSCIEPHNIPGRNSLRHFRVSAPETMNSPSPR
jgi:hypothetical protein